MEPTPFINKQNKQPVYMQIYHFFRKEIEEGRLGEGTKLPSIRQLSGQINVSRNTVELAYQQLVAEGYLESREKKGLFVLELDEEWIRNGEEPKGALYRLDQKAETKDLIDFQYGDIELNRFPIKAWRKCLMDATEIPTQEVFSYGDRRGHLGLRKEIASYLYHARGVQCLPEQIIITAGIQSAVQILISLLNLSGQKVGLENPGYDGVRHVFKSQHCQVMPISLEEDGINVEELVNSEANCVYVTPSHQFPLGMILPIQKRLKLLQWAQEHKGYILEDDYDGEFRYIGQPIPSLKSLDTTGRVIYLGTFSKAFLPAARLSYIVLPKGLLEKFDKELFYFQQTVSPIIQESLYLFLKEGHFSRHIRKMRKIYQEKHKALVAAIELHLGNEVEIIGQKSGLHLIVDLKKRDAGCLVEQAKEQGVSVYLTNRFWYKGSSPKNKQHIMMGFGGLSEENIHKGISILGSIISQGKRNMEV